MRSDTFGALGPCRSQAGCSNASLGPADAAGPQAGQLLGELENRQLLCEPAARASGGDSRASRGPAPLVSMTSDGRTVKVRPARITCPPPARRLRSHPTPGRREQRDDESPVAYESKEGRSIVAARASTAVEDDGQRWLSLAYRPWMRLVTSLLKRAAPR
jgi:hypothetical protein